MQPAWQVMEVRNAEGLPVRVLPIRTDAPLELEPGQSVQCVVSLPVSAVTARRIARERSRMIAAWCGHELPPWLESYCPMPAGDYCRPIRRIWPDGQIDCYPSIASGARALG